MIPHGSGHPVKCPCALCALLRAQADGAKTTKENRVNFTLHLTKQERDQLRELADRIGCSAKSVAESAVRSILP